MKDILQDLRTIRNEMGEIAFDIPVDKANELLELVKILNKIISKLKEKFDEEDRPKVHMSYLNKK